MATGYGSDTWCDTSLKCGRRSRGVQNVALALYRRLITPRGTLRPLLEDSNEDELAYGFDLAAYCGAVGPERAVLTAPSQIRGELMKDDRVAEVVVVGSFARNPDGTAALFFKVAVTLRDSNENFDFTVKVANLTTSLLLGGA